MENRIKQLREEQHMTQVRLSIELGISQETVSAYESGKHYPSVAILIRLSEIFHTSCDYILGLSDLRHPAGAAMKQQEQLLLLRFSRLSPHQRELLMAYLEGMLSL